MKLFCLPLWNVSFKRARALSLFFSTESQELRRAQAQEYLVNKWLDGKWVLHDQIGSRIAFRLVTRFLLPLAGSEYPWKHLVLLPSIYYFL